MSQNIYAWKQLKFPLETYGQGRYTYTYNGILLSERKEWNPVICNSKNGPREYYANWNVRQTNLKYCRFHLYVESKIFKNKHNKSKTDL